MKFRDVSISRNPIDLSAIKEMWGSCLFIFDTNILLNLYRYSEETYIDFMNTLESSEINDKIWIPFQVAKEFHANRIETIRDQKNAYTRIISEIEKRISGFVSGELIKYTRHSRIDVSEVVSILEDSKNKIVLLLKNQEENHPNFLNEDPIYLRLEKLFDDKIGNEFSDESLAKIYEIGSERYASSIPPGYEDSKKSGNEKYGDLIIWNEILNFAKENSLPFIIFVTDDAKEDWWVITSGQKLSLRYELIEEIYKSSHTKIHAYDSSSFLKYAKQFLSSSISQNSIDEAHSVRLKFSEKKPSSDVATGTKILIAEALRTYKRGVEGGKNTALELEARLFKLLNIIIREIIKQNLIFESDSIDLVLKTFENPEDINVQILIQHSYIDLDTLVRDIKDIFLPNFQLPRGFFESLISSTLHMDDEFLLEEELPF